MIALESLRDIRALVPVDGRLLTSGQPTVDQLEGLAAAGLRHVINIALPTSDHAVADEAARVTAQGMNYLHLPVIWDAPSPEQFTRFSQMLWALREEPVLVHCALNMRASAFVFLYRVLHEAVPVVDAEEAMHQIWQPTGVWLDFIQKVLAPSGEVYLPAEGLA